MKHLVTSPRTQEQPGEPPRPALLGAVIARMLLEEVEAGRWIQLESGELVPVDMEHTFVVSLREEEMHKEEIDAQAGDVAPTSQS